VGPPRTGPHGLSSYDGELRRLSTLGRFDEAATLAEEEAGAAGDDVLAALNLAIVEHHAGRYEESNELLQAAELEIEERFTKSVSRAALSLVTNDRALAWLPSRAERPMVHVYGALNYLALGQPDEAAVEARRLAGVLEEMVGDDGPAGLDAETRQVYRSLRYFTGAVFEHAGEWNDADVAYRPMRRDVRAALRTTMPTAVSRTPRRTFQLKRPAWSSWSNRASSPTVSSGR
jgi:tetratricopeptide (TPR) repeat protein